MSENEGLVTKANCPEARDIVLLTDAARMLGFSRQNAHRMADRGKFTTLQSLGGGTVFIVDRTEVEAMASERSEAASHKDEA